jgi:hypothetical protein
VGHPRTKLTVFGRQLLISRVETLGRPVAHAAAMQGIFRATAYKWLRRYRAEGEPGLVDRSSRPRGSPRALSADPGAGDRRRPDRAPLGSASAGLSDRPSALDLVRHPASGRSQPAPGR